MRWLVTPEYFAAHMRELGSFMVQQLKSVEYRRDHVLFKLLPKSKPSS
jgi:hypothetical protein